MRTASDYSMTYDRYKEKCNSQFVWGWEKQCITIVAMLLKAALEVHIISYPIGRVLAPIK